MQIQINKQLVAYIHFSFNICASQQLKNGKKPWRRTLKVKCAITSSHVDKTSQRK